MKILKISCIYIFKGILKNKWKICERGATARGCSGSIGSDDTRGYGVGSGDVGKELPRGMIP